MANAKLEWIDPDGVVYNLTDYTFSTYFAEGPLPLTGQYGLVLEIISHEVPMFAGVREQYIQVKANDVRFPLRVFGATEEELQNNLDILSEATRPNRGVGILQYTRPNGVTKRQLICRETARMRQVSGRAPGWVQLGMIFSAADPFWYDSEWTTLNFAPAGVVNFFQNPFLPLNLSVGGLSSSFTVDNQGQDVAWPVWTITGPGINPVLTNVTTNEVLTLSITLLADQVLTVDTRPLYINAYREDNSNQWSTISDTSQLWPLVPGPNSISLSMTGTSSASRLKLQYKQCYEGA